MSEETNNNSWQPIETAPKDGTWVKLRNEDNGLEDVGFYDDYRLCFPEIGIEGEWSTWLGNGNMTHWAKLTEEERKNYELATY